MTDEDLELEVPDIFNSARECFVHQHARPIIGVAPHTHTCRREPKHDGKHKCICGGEW